MAILAHWARRVRAQFMTHALGHAELFGGLREWNLFEQRWLRRIILTFFKITHSDAH